jgi:hypothetical protein
VRKYQSRPPCPTMAVASAAGIARPLLVGGGARHVAKDANANDVVADLGKSRLRHRQSSKREHGREAKIWAWKVVPRCGHLPTRDWRGYGAL